MVAKLHKIENGTRWPNKHQRETVDTHPVWERSRDVRVQECSRSVHGGARHRKDENAVLFGIEWPRVEVKAQECLPVGETEGKNRLCRVQCSHSFADATPILNFHPYTHSSSPAFRKLTYMPTHSCGGNINPKTHCEFHPIYACLGRPFDPRHEHISYIIPL